MCFLFQNSKIFKIQVIVTYAIKTYSWILIWPWASNIPVNVDRNIFYNPSPEYLSKPDLYIYFIDSINKNIIKTKQNSSKFL